MDDRNIKRLAPWIYDRNPNSIPQNDASKQPTHKHNLAPSCGIYFPEMGLNKNTESPGIANTNPY